MNPLQSIPPRVKYYLLDFKDCHYNDFYDRYHKEALKDLTFEELSDFLKYVSEIDCVTVFNTKVKKNPDDCDFDTMT